MSTMMLPAANQQLAKNPQLPGLPATGNMDSQYLAEEAALRSQISKDYADVLQQLGWVDETGNFIPGIVSTNAAAQQRDLERASYLAGQDVESGRVNAGGYLGGRTAYDVARAQFPMERQIAQLGVDTPLALGQLYEKGAGLIDQYTIQNNILLAQMAARQAALIAKNPAGAPGGGTTTGGGGTQTQGAGHDIGIANAGGTGTTQDPIIPAGEDRQLPAPIVNQNPGAPGQVFVPVQMPDGSISYEPKPNPASYGQPAPAFPAAPGGSMAEGSQLVGPDEMPKPNPASYGQPNPELPTPESTWAPEAQPAEGSVFTPTSSGGEPDVMPHPNPESYGQPPVATVDPGQLLDTINNAINAGPPPTTTNSGGQVYTQTNQGKYGKKPMY
jgi:hypothetical protein